MFRYTRLLFICLLIAVTLSSKYLEESCDRIRKPMHLLTNHEKTLFVEGYQRLREHNTLTAISKTHAFNKHKIHHRSNSFFWHEYLLWELETQIRALGDKFKCFSLPYWDFSIDSGKSNDDKFILSESLLGADGDIDNHLCIKAQPNNNDNNLWSLDRYAVPDPSGRNFCLKRKVSKVINLPTPAELAVIIVTETNFENFTKKINKLHGTVHAFFGGDDDITMKGDHATDDPIFFVLHSYMMFLRLLWTSCNNLDDININPPSLDENQPFFDAFCNEEEPDCGVTRWHDTMDYYPMDSTDLDWPLVSESFKLKLKDLYNPIDWGIKYELGNFLQNTHLDKWCDNINNEWFIESEATDLDRVGDSYKSDVQAYIDQLWSNMNENELQLGIIEMFKVADEFSCKYNRQHGANSCWNKDAFENIETCNDRNIDDPKQLTLKYLLDFDGVKDNECLKQIRIDNYNAFLAFGDDVNLRICNGELDYQCNEYETEHKQEMANNKELVNNNNMNFITEEQNNHNKIKNTAVLKILFFTTLILAILIRTLYQYFKKQNDYHSKKLLSTTDSLYSTF